MLQLAVWNVIVMSSKLALFVLEFFLRNVLDKISQILLGWM